jgi:hypothetical protein
MNLVLAYTYYLSLNDEVKDHVKGQMSKVGMKEKE